MLKITKAAFKQLVDACKREFPKEACGLIAGVKRSEDLFIKGAFPLRNVTNSPFIYETDAEEVYNASISMEKLGLNALGIYHSHPFSRAEPSELDKRTAFHPSMIYVIVSLMEDVADVRAYLWNGEKFINCPISVEMDREQED
ncbi:MAG: M67 family metallopeptidase [Candidatus Bathyarchaeia archaeon]